MHAPSLQRLPFDGRVTWCSSRPSGAVFARPRSARAGRDTTVVGAAELAASWVCGGVHMSKCPPPRRARHAGAESRPLATPCCWRWRCWLCLLVGCSAPSPCAPVWCRSTRHLSVVPSA